MDLSILIATVPPRKKYLNRLLTNLQNQIVKNNLQNKVEVIVFEDDFDMVLGEKKNKLYESAKGKYIVSIDDDDMIDDDYCKLICEAIDNHDVDQICIGHRYFHNSNSKSIPIVVSKDTKYYSMVFLNLFILYITKYHKETGNDWELYFRKIPILKVKGNTFKGLFLMLFLLIFKNGLTKGLRYTCHTTPIKKEIVQSVRFSNRPREQDIEWATEIYKKNLIKSEYTIDKDLYLYYFDTEMSINRGKSGWMTKEEKRKKLTETLSTIKDFEWEYQTIDKINIRWI